MWRSDLNLTALCAAAEGIYDGWYTDRKIDWYDFIDRLEAQTGTDLGDNMRAPYIRAVQRHIYKYRQGD
jgi:hypothetical protein